MSILSKLKENFSIKKKTSNDNQLMLTNITPLSDNFEIQNRTTKIIAKPGKGKNIIFISLDNQKLNLFIDFFKQNNFNYSICRFDNESNKTEISCESKCFLLFEEHFHKLK